MRSHLTLTHSTDDREVVSAQRARDGELASAGSLARASPIHAAELTPATMQALQRTIGNAATASILRSRAQAEPGSSPRALSRPLVQRQQLAPFTPGDAFADAASGPSSALPHRARMEAAYGQSFAGVSAHVATSQARRGLGALGARAAAFGDSVAFADPNPSAHDVAHELAHVVQQRRATQGVQAKAAAVSHPAEQAERAADRAADAVVRGEPVPAVGSADRGKVHRTTVNTNGGVFDNASGYDPISGTGVVGERVGANIGVDFIAGDLVEAPIDGIVLTQTVKSVTDRVPDTTTLNPTRDQGNTAVSTDADDTGLVTPGGVAIDVPIHPGGRDEPSHNPIYGVGFGAAAPSTSLSDGTPTLGRTQRGAHVRNPVTGALDPPVNAQMEDGPGRRIRVAGQTFEMTFEIAALVTAGPMADTYLGSVEWGWQSDAAGIVTLKPFVALASGAPTATFMTAATTWNAAVFHDDSLWSPRWLQDLMGWTVDSVDLPITTLPSGVTAAVDMSTVDILARLPVVRAEIAGLPAGTSVDRTNKEFELRALATELAKRKVDVDLTCHSLSDTGGAASPAEDEIWLALTGGGSLAMALTATRRFTPGQSHKFQFPVSDFLPLTAPVHLDVSEHDRAGSTSAAHDDVLVALDWAAPFTPVVRADAGTHYTVRVGFDK